MTFLGCSGLAFLEVAEGGGLGLELGLNPLGIRRRSRDARSHVGVLLVEKLERIGSVRP